MQDDWLLLSRKNFETCVFVDRNHDGIIESIHFNSTKSDIGKYEDALRRSIATISVTDHDSARSTGGADPIEFCKEVSLIAKDVMTARQKERPMSETLPATIEQFLNLGDKFEKKTDPDTAEKTAASLVMMAYRRTSYPVEYAKREAVDDFENDTFESCYKDVTVD